MNKMIIFVICEVFFKHAFTKQGHLAQGEFMCSFVAMIYLNGLITVSGDWQKIHRHLICCTELVC